jgi:hypothetical protein
MGDAVPLIASVTEVREVVETFRRYAVLRSDWATVIESAAERLSSSHIDQVGEQAMHDVTARLEKLLANGAWADRALVDQVAADVVELLSLTWPEDLPRPEDEDWSFPRVNCA